MEMAEHFWSGFKRGARRLADSLKAKDRGGVDYKMLLIGETGSGKTSFLNLLCNFAEVLKLKNDASIKKLNKFHDEALENVKAKEMESLTTGATYYQIQYEGVILGVVDTPGFGDTRGLDQDKENVKKIVDKVNDVEYINCVCLVINGRVARMTHQLKYVIAQISAVLPKVTANNVIVVFTNAKKKEDTNFQVDQLTPFLGHTIPDDKVFYIDNPWCILDKMDKTKKTKDLTKAFRRASESLGGMFDIIESFAPVHTTLFMDLFLAKEAVEMKVHELLLAVQNKTILEETITAKKAEIDAAIATKSLSANFETKIKVPRWAIQPTPGYNTVCQLCNSNCHLLCGLPLVKGPDKEQLKGCTCMSGSQLTCSICGHSYAVHCHGFFLNKLEEVETSIINKDMKEAFEKSEIEIESLAREMKEKLDIKFQEIAQEIDDLYLDLNNKIHYFETHASTPNYLKLLQCQLVVVDQRIIVMSEAGNITSAHDLNRTKEELKKKIALVEKGL